MQNYGTENEGVRNLRADRRWPEVNKNNISALQAFIDEFSGTERADEARRIIGEIRHPKRYAVLDFIDRIENVPLTVIDPDEHRVNIIVAALNPKNRSGISKDEFLRLIARDNNFLRASVIKKLLQNGTISAEDLENIGIDGKFLYYLNHGKASSNSDDISPTKPLERIEFPSTEVYFWGIPASGKSCALGAILSVANNGHVARSMIKENDCQGYAYMMHLSRCFLANGRVCTLPASTSIYSTSAMSFSLEDDDNCIHPITCIDLAGELTRCMYKKDAGIQLTTGEENALKTVSNILTDKRTGSRKIHFFVLEYGADGRLYEGLSQREYLEAALNYIRSTRIFKSDTDAVYLIMTKVDKSGLTGDELKRELSNYIERNYQSFYNGLQRICRENEINGGIVERKAFYIGQVCFQDYCLFDETAAANIVKILINRTKGFRKKGFWANISNALRK